jgi:hypothetical protein
MRSQDVISTLVADASEQRLRAFVAELVAALLRCLIMPPASVPATASNGRRRSRHAKPSDNKTRRHWTPAQRDAMNAKRRAKRQAAKAAAPGNGRKRRGRKPKAAAAAGNGAEATADGRRVPVTAKAFWRHAAKLSPQEPWRAIVRELGVAESTAQGAMRDAVLPCTPRAAARFLTL